MTYTGLFVGMCVAVMLYICHKWWKELGREQFAWVGQQFAAWRRQSRARRMFRAISDPKNAHVFSAEYVRKLFAHIKVGE